MIPQEIYSNSNLTKVAWYYYKENVTQSDIANYMGLSRNQVVRMLERARAEGFVEFQIHGVESNSMKLKEELVRIYDLQDAVIVPSPMNKENQRVTLAKAAAQYLQSRIEDNDLIGVGWGETISLTIDDLSIQEEKCFGCDTYRGVNHYYQYQ
ncbi:sugar-binding domain-containing protein, partial [Geomicrobium sp. JCM 19039]|uniref:sugar-binding domain-containing protein n=1 Tax=Geomicrobium sp. JCM 19039 TaxID=1460636 RepID=UPI0026F3C3AE